MPFRNARTHLRDIATAIDLIAQFMAGMDLESYKADAKTHSAVERQMQIITEAAVRLGEDAERLCPGLDWKGYRGMGNVLRHEYHRSTTKSCGTPSRWNCLHCTRLFQRLWNRWAPKAAVFLRG